jgi:hypothetical protein
LFHFFLIPQVGYHVTHFYGNLNVCNFTYTGSHLLFLNSPSPEAYLNISTNVHSTYPSVLNPWYHKRKFHKHDPFVYLLRTLFCCHNTRKHMSALQTLCQISQVVFLSLYPIILDCCQQILLLLCLLSLIQLLRNANTTYRDYLTRQTWTMNELNVIWWAGYPSQNSMTLQLGLMTDEITHQGGSAATQWDN